MCGRKGTMQRLFHVESTTPTPRKTSGTPRYSFLVRCLLCQVSAQWAQVWCMQLPWCVVGTPCTQSQGCSCDDDEEDDDSYVALFSALKQTHCTFDTSDSKWVTVTFYAHFSMSTKVQCCLVVTWLVPLETAAILAHSVYTVQPCSMLHHFMQSHIHTVHAKCLTVTCHLHFWQDDQDRLCATAVACGWNGYRNKNQHRKFTLDKKILPLLQPELEPETFWSQVQCSNHWVIPASCGSLHCLAPLSRVHH